MALSITTIGVTAGDGDREPAHTGAISIFMDNHEPVARASRVGRTAKVSGVDNSRRGEGRQKKCLRLATHTLPRLKRSLAIHRPVSAQNCLLVLQRYSAFRLVHKRVLRSLSRSSLRILLGGHDYIQVSNRKRPHQQHQVGARRGNLHHHLHPRACRPARPSGRRGRRRRSPAPRVCHWKGPRPLLCPCKPTGGSGGRGGGLQQRGARLSQSPPPHLPFQIVSFYS